MRKWLTWLSLAVWLALPMPAFAAPSAPIQGRFAAAMQTDIRLSRLLVQLQPEYDQPSMLVIYEFELASGIALPAGVTFELPGEADLLAVASLQNGVLMNANFEGPVVKGDAQALTINVDAPTRYHLEYYQPLDRQGSRRQFNFTWKGDYAVDEFSLRVQRPPDATSLTTDPPLTTGQDPADGLTYYASQPLNLPAGAPFSLVLQYDKPGDALTLPSAGAPSSAGSSGTAFGWMTAGDAWRYGLGALGIVLIALGAGYYFKMGGRRAGPEAEESDSSGEVFCHQCGQRARPGDRFCRSCGTRLRREG